MAATSFRTLLDSAMAQARSAPADPSVRMKLFRLFCVSGQWDRAATQADTGSNLDAELGFTTLVYKQALACEKFRADVFAGTRVPVIAGEPPQWLALMLEALRAEAGGDQQALARAAQLRGQALEGAQAVAGTLNGQAFEWVADADPRLGPVCECFIDGKYYWVPFDRIAKIELPEPDDVLDTVWASAQVEFTTGGTKHVLMPVRYPGTESSQDDDLLFARKTVWDGSDDTGWTGMGQRVWTTDAAELGMLDVRELILQA